jgi:hypothetical protein
MATVLCFESIEQVELVQREINVSTLLIYIIPQLASKIVLLQRRSQRKLRKAHLSFRFNHTIFVQSNPHVFAGSREVGVFRGGIEAVE